MKGIDFGKPTDRERDLLLYLGNCIADYIEKTPTDRSELLCAFSLICSLMFTNQTPITDVDAQCAEIDVFCDFLKLRAREGKRNE